MWVTLEEVAAAIEKNGLIWARGTFLRYEIDEDTGEEYPVAACALGQAAYNLGVDYADLDFKLNMLMPGKRLSSKITNYNDRDAGDYQDVVKYSKALLEPYKARKIRLISKDY